MKTAILDGPNAMWRLFHKMPILTNPYGQPIQLVYGFLKLLHGVIIDLEPDAVLIAWDEGWPRIRLEIFPDYKKDRILVKKHPDPERKKAIGTVAIQTRMLREFLPMLGISQMWIDGIEADDIMAMACDALHGERVVVSTDTDMLQLVRKRVSIWSPVKRLMYTHDNFEKTFKLTPRQYMEAKALAGEKGDGIPGVAVGFGEKTATELVQKYGSGAEVFKHEDELRKRKGRYALVCGHEEEYGRNLLLMDLTIMESLTAKRMIVDRIEHPQKIDVLEVRKYLRKHQFESLLNIYLDWIRAFRSLGTRRPVQGGLFAH